MIWGRGRERKRYVGWNQIEGLVSLSKDAEDIKRSGIIETLGMWHIFSLVPKFFNIVSSPILVQCICVCVCVYIMCACVHVHTHVLMNIKARR